MVPRTGKHKLDSIAIWLRVACRGNWSTKSVEDNKVCFLYMNILYRCFAFSILTSVYLFSIYVKPLLGVMPNIPIPGRREMNDSVPVLRSLHLKNSEFSLQIVAQRSLSLWMAHLYLLKLNA